MKEREIERLNKLKEYERNGVVFSLNDKEKEILKSGTVEMKGEEITGGEFTIDMTSLKTADSEKLQGHLKSPDFFDVEKFKCYNGDS